MRHQARPSSAFLGGSRLRSGSSVGSDEPGVPFDTWRQRPKSSSTSECASQGKEKRLAPDVLLDAGGASDLKKLISGLLRHLDIRRRRRGLARSRSPAGRRRARAIRTGRVMRALLMNPPLADPKEVGRPAAGRRGGWGLHGTGLPVEFRGNLGVQRLFALP